MKTFIKILFILAIMPLSQMLAGDYKISGKLMTKITETITSPGGTVTDCNGGTVTLAPSSVTNTRYSPASFTNVTIKVYKLDSSNTLVTTIANRTKAQISWNANPSNAADSGNFNYTITGLSNSRFNYRAYVYLDGDATSTYSEEFMLNSGGGIPIGTVYAYVGNQSNLANLEVNGWFKCDGRSISTLSELTSTEKNALQDVLGGETTLPDLRGVFLRGLDDQDINGNYRNWDDDRTARTGGESTIGVRSSQFESMRKHTHAGTTDGNGAHTHTVSAPSGYRWIRYSGNNTAGAAADVPLDSSPNEPDLYDSGTTSGGSTSDPGNHTHTFSTGDPANSTDGRPHLSGNETRPDNYAVYWLIRGR